MDKKLYAYVNKIRLYNAVNVREGFRNIEIRTPRNFLDYENKD